MRERAAKRACDKVVGARAPPASRPRAWRWPGPWPHPGRGQEWARREEWGVLRAFLPVRGRGGIGALAHGRVAPFPCAPLSLPLPLCPPAARQRGRGSDTRPQRTDDLIAGHGSTGKGRGGELVFVRSSRECASEREEKTVTHTHTPLATPEKARHTHTEIEGEQCGGAWPAMGTKGKGARGSEAVGTGGAALPAPEKRSRGRTAPRPARSPCLLPSLRPSLSPTAQPSLTRIRHALTASWAPASCPGRRLWRKKEGNVCVS